MKRTSACLAAAVIAAGVAWAQSPAPTFDAYVEANRPKMAVRVLTKDEVGAARKAVNAWKGKKTEANLAAVKPFAEAGDIAAMRAMMDGYVALQSKPNDRGASAALAKPGQGLIPMAGLWAMNLWRVGQTDRDVAKSLALCMKGKSISDPDKPFSYTTSVQTQTSTTAEYDCGFDTTGLFIAIGRVLDLGGAKPGKEQARKDPIPPLTFTERSLVSSGKVDEQRLAGILQSVRAGYGYPVSPIDQAWLDERVRTNPAAKAAYDKALFGKAMDGMHASGVKPSPTSWVWAYMDADPARKTEYNQAFAMAQIDGAERAANFDATIATATNEDRDRLANFALSQGGTAALKWWDRYQHTISVSSAYEFERWCNAGVDAACRRITDARLIEEARRNAPATGSGSSYAGTDPAAATQAAIDRSNAVNAANCARADLGASISCNRN